MKITTLISVRNKVRLVERAIRSACEQTHKPCEVVVMDDASTDGSLEVVRRLAKELPIRVVERPEKLPDWIRSELELSRDCQGDYFHRLGADDYIFPGFYAMCREGTGAGVVQANVRVITLNGQLKVSSSNYAIRAGHHLRTEALRRWLVNPQLPSGVCALTDRATSNWLLSTHFERCGTWMDSICLAAASWVYGLYFVPTVQGVWTEDPESFGGENRPLERRISGRDGCRAWLGEVSDVVPPDIREALVRVVGEG